MLQHDESWFEFLKTCWQRWDVNFVFNIAPEEEIYMCKIRVPGSLHQAEGLTTSQFCLQFFQQSKMGHKSDF
jgi:hypothetical protein